MQTVPASPKGIVHTGCSKTSRQQHLQINGMSVGKNRRVTNSVSATSMPRLNNQNSPQVNRQVYNSTKQTLENKAVTR